MQSFSMGIRDVQNGFLKFGSVSESFDEIPWFGSVQFQFGSVSLKHGSVWFHKFTLSYLKMNVFLVFSKRCMHA